MLRLPDEILLKIMSYVPIESKLEVANTCKRMRAVLNTELADQGYLHQTSTRTK